MITAREEDIAYRQQELMDTLPDYYQESPEANAIMHGNAIEFERKRAEGQDLLNQFFVTTATWGLDYWDRVLDLPKAPRMDVSQRRERILAKLNGAAPATIKNLTELLNVYTQRKDAHIKEFPRDYRFEAYFSMGDGENLKTSDVYRAMNEVKPAHLEFLLNIVVGTIFVLTTRNYEFPVFYKICNTFRTEDVKGGLAKINLAITSRAYSFDVDYPVTNEFRTSGEVTRLSSETIELEAYATSNPVIYRRVGSAIVGKEVARKQSSRFDTLLTFSGESSSNPVDYLRVGSAVTGKGNI